jgi:hypothetical protein
MNVTKRATRALAILAICATLLLGAAAVIQGTATQVVRDPENPYFAGNTISVPTDGGARVVRDPQNPYFAGNTLESPSLGGGSMTANLK